MRKKGGSSFWGTRRVLVTGGAVFFGTFIVERLKASGTGEVIVPRSRDYDLVDGAAVRRLYADARPHPVIHLAATLGRIRATQRPPGGFSYKNLLIGPQTME